MGTGAAAPEASEMQTMRSKLEELNRRSEHDIKAVNHRSDEILQRAEAS